MKAVIIDMLHLPTNRLCYDVVIYDGHDYPSLLITFDKQKAEKLMDEYNNQEAGAKPE